MILVAEILCVGTELLLGNIVNTNAAYLAQICAKTGVFVYYQSCVGDNEPRLLEAIKTAINRSDVLILSGGLGPTKDDLTKECVAKAIELPLIEDVSVRKSIEDYFKRIGRISITDNNWKQALVPEGAKVLTNKNGTAPGLIIKKDSKHIILLPGPPIELIPLVEEEVLPYLASLQDMTIYSTMVKLVGIGESKVETMILDLIDRQSNPTIAPYAKLGEVHLRVTAASKDIETAKELSKPIMEELVHRFGNYIYSFEEDKNLEDVVVDLLNRHHLTITTAESCTGGLVASRLINVTGASSVIKQGFVTYSDEAKHKYLQVKQETLEQYTAVSNKTAEEMAIGAAFTTGSEVSISVSGLAGPDGGTDTIPVGTVFIGCYCKGKTLVKEFHFSGNRNKVRESAVIGALNLVRMCILENYKN